MFKKKVQTFFNLCLNLIVQYIVALVTIHSSNTICNNRILKCKHYLNNFCCAEKLHLLFLNSESTKRQGLSILDLAFLPTVHKYLISHFCLDTDKVSTCPCSNCVLLNEVP